LFLFDFIFIFLYYVIRKHILIFHVLATFMYRSGIFAWITVYREYWASGVFLFIFSLQNYVYCDNYYNNDNNLA